MKQSLYKISEELIELTEEIAISEGELTDSQDKLLIKVQDKLLNKTEDVVHFINYQEDLVEMAKKRIKELDHFVKTTGNALARFDDYISTCLDMLGTKKITSGIYSISKNKPREIVNITDETKLPGEFIEVPIPEARIMKKEIAEALKNGVEVPGAELIESLKPSIKYGIKKGKL